MRETLHRIKFQEVRSAGITAEDLIAKFYSPDFGDFISESFRNQIIEFINASYQIKNVPIRVEYMDPRNRLMYDFMAPEPTEILSNRATGREEVICKTQGVFYNTDNLKAIKFQDQIKR
jgi:hypothetical protein